MKRVEMELELFELGFTDVQDIKIKELRALYKRAKEIHAADVKVDPTNIAVEKTTQESVEETIERKPEPEKTKLQILREELRPKIKIFIDKFRSRNDINKDEREEMYRLYNAYFQRNDSGSCGSCVARAFAALKKLVKND